MMKQMFATVGLAALAASVLAGPKEQKPVPFSQGWLVQPVVAPAKQPLDKVIPFDKQEAAWKPGKFEGNPPLAEGAKSGNRVEGDYSCWYKKPVFIPAEWQGKAVTLDFGLYGANAVAYVNGKAAGVALHPVGSVDITDRVDFGKTNEVMIFVSNRGYGSGEGEVAYWGRDDRNRGMLGIDFWGVKTPSVALNVRTLARVTDVYLQPSWREKKLGVTVEIVATKACKGKFALELSEDLGRDPATKQLRDGKVLKSHADTYKLKPGVNTFSFDIPWADVIPWEAVEKPQVYDWQAKLTVDGNECDAPAKQVFGFREIWREGRQIMMNGHVQRFRGAFYAPDDIAQIHPYGFNLHFQTHQHEAGIVEKPENMEKYTRAGVCIFRGMPPIYYCTGGTDRVVKDENCRRQWLRYVERWLRTMRNYPCIAASNCGVNMVCPERNMRPEMLGQDHEDGGVARNIEFACDCVRKLHPNCLYFSHADGTEADISSSNLYFNFTPLQEREEWLEPWSRNGTLPWAAAEFGAPYGGCWFHARTPQFTEWLATYYGDAAYAAEDDLALEYAKELSRICRGRIHGADVKGKGPYELNSLCDEYTRMLVYRTNRAWRYFGVNAGVLYLTGWKWERDDVKCQSYAQANGDIVAFLGGATNVTDRTHAYWSGSEVRRSLVLIWDGLGENTFTAEWKVTSDDKTAEVIAEGRIEEKLLRGETRLSPIVFAVPEVKKRASYKLSVTVEAAKDMDEAHFANWTCHTDEIPIDVYPPFAKRSLGNPKQVLVFDPAGETSETLTALGVGFTPVEAVSNLVAAVGKGGVKCVIVGKNALVNAEGLQQLAPAVENGLRVLVMPQTAEVWQMLGFKVEDSMARKMYPAYLNGVDEVDLNHWAFAPKCEKATGNVMKHETRRGPRWTHDFAISAMPLLIPQKAGFLPLVRGEFDLSYSALLKLVRGTGFVEFCAFDFDGRVGEGKCPAATKVAQAMLSDFGGGKSEYARQVLTDGAHAARIAKALGVEAKPLQRGEQVENALILLGKDSALTPTEVAGLQADPKNCAVMAVANEAFAATLGGFDLTRTIAGDVVVGKDGKLVYATNLVAGAAYRVTAPGDKFWNRFRGLKLHGGLLRARDGFGAAKLKLTDKKNRELAMAESGFVAAKGNVFLEMMDPFEVCDRYRDSADFKTEELKGQGWGSQPKNDRDLYLRNAAQSEDNTLRRYALLFANWGVGASSNLVARALYTKPYESFEPITQYNVLGPWPSAKGDNSEYMVESIFPVDESKGGTSGAEAEAMAIRGDVQPNPWFYPQELKFPDDLALKFLDWRPVVKSAPTGLVNLYDVPLIAAQSFQTSYAVGFLERETDGEITVRFGVDWRGKFWVNGQELGKTYGGAKDEGSIIVEHVKVWAKPKGLTGEALQAFDQEHGTFDGKNVVTVKAGSGMSAATFYLNVTKEIKPGEVVREEIPALQAVDLYESANPGFDPYEYVYW